MIDTYVCYENEPFYCNALNMLPPNDYIFIGNLFWIRNNQSGNGFWFYSYALSRSTLIWRVHQGFIKPIYVWMSKYPSVVIKATLYFAHMKIDSSQQIRIYVNIIKFRYGSQLLRYLNTVFLKNITINFCWFKNC